MLYVILFAVDDRLVFVIVVVHVHTFMKDKTYIIVRRIEMDVDFIND